MPIQHDRHVASHTCPVCGENHDAKRWVDPDVWDRRDMRYALATRDIKMIYEILQRHGVSQRKIAARTGQSQSEVSEILSGRRVWSYEVLLRIARGLDVPRSWMGLAFDTDDGEPPQLA